MALTTSTTAAEVLRADALGPWVLTCEHAGAALPPGLTVSDTDRAALATHWGYDLGARALTTTLSQILQAPAVLGVFSRLYIDLNRDPSQPSLVLREVEGVPLGFNASCDQKEERRRLKTHHDAYHRQIEAVLNQRAHTPHPFMLLSVHSFTPNYMGQQREVEYGVLYDEHEDLAHQLYSHLRQTGRDTRLNEPWSGKAGLMYAAQRHGRAAGVPYLEIEVRQDLLESSGAVAAIAHELSTALLNLTASATSRGGLGETSE